MAYRFGALELRRPFISAEPQCLEPVKVVTDQYRFVISPPFDTPTFVYISGDRNALPYYGPVLVGPGCVLPSMSIDEVNITVPPVEQIPGSQLTFSHNFG